MAKEKNVFYCTDCGNEVLRWQGQCPACGAWNTIVERPSTPKSKTPKSTSGRRETAGIGFSRSRFSRFGGGRPRHWQIYLNASNL